MLFRSRDLDAIRNGSIDLAFRRWRRPTVKAGTGLRFAGHLIEILSVARVAGGDITDEEARRAGHADLSALRAGLRPSPEGDLYRISLRYAGLDPRRTLAATVPPDEAIDAILARLERMDARSRGGAWTADMLSLIAAYPGTRAGHLAARLGRETLKFKADVRKLKELGLTESLEVGYRLSPRGEAVLQVLREGGGKG